MEFPRGLKEPRGSGPRRADCETRAPSPGAVSAIPCQFASSCARVSQICRRRNTMRTIRPMLFNDRYNTSYSTGCLRYSADLAIGNIESMSTSFTNLNSGTSTNELPRQLEREGTLLAQLASLTKPDAYDTTYLTHGIHPYPAKYIPQLPNLIIREHTNERNTVFDPFCGSGTTLLEATLLGRKSIGVDSNCVAALISGAKSTALTEGELDIAEEFLASLEEILPAKAGTLPRHALEMNLQHWFQSNVTLELCALRSHIDTVESFNLKNFLLCIFSSIIVSVSNQESETRYAAINKGLPDFETFKRFKRKLIKEITNLKELSRIPNAKKNTPKILNSDIRNLSQLGISNNSVDLVVTSPPYPNSFDYYLYHKWRLFWLGFDFKQVMRDEIGSRHEHSSRKLSIDSYIEKMRKAILPVASVLKPSKLAYFFVGDAVIGGQLFNIATVFEEVVKETGLRLIADTNYSLESISRSFHEKTSDGCHGGRRNLKKLQHVLVFEKYNRAKISVPSGRTEASATTRQETIKLGEFPISDGSLVALSSKDEQRHIHSVGRYPSKFIPEIPRWAIEAYSNNGDVVLDPFSGSGTTAVEAVLSGRRAIASDISPYSTLLTRAKTANVDESALRTWTEKFVAEIGSGFPNSHTRATRFDLDDFWFPTGYLDEIVSAQQYVFQFVPPEFRDLFNAAISTAIRPCSYQDEGQIKVKRDPKKVLTGTPRPQDILPHLISKAVDRKVEFLRMLKYPVSVMSQTLSADALLSNGFVQESSVNLVVTSPPYINAMNYAMTHRYENIALGLLNPDDKTHHERLYFGSERVYADEYSALRSFSNSFARSEELNTVLSKIFASEPKRSFITYRFFSLMMNSFIDIYKALKPGGHLVLVVGRNTIRNIPVDTFGFLVSILESIGMKKTLYFEYEIIKNAFKLTRNSTAGIIKTDGVAVLQKPETY